MRNVRRHAYWAASFWIAVSSVWACKPTFLSPSASSASLSASPSPSASAAGSGSAASASGASAAAAVAADTLVSVTPASGTAAGGSAVTLAGTGFLTGATVDFGGAACTSVVRVSQAEIDCVTPLHAAGPVTVSVTNPSGSPISLAAGYTFNTGAAGFLGYYQHYRPNAVGVTPDPSAADGGMSVPQGSAIDSSGSFLFLADTSNNRVSKYNLSTMVYIGSIGNVATAAGTCVAGGQTSWCQGGSFSSGAINGAFNTPSTVAVHPSSTILYVTDPSNFRVQRFNSATGAFLGAIGNSTAAGTCTAGAQTAWCSGGTFSTGGGDGMFSSVDGVAIDPGGNFLYVSSNARIQKFNASSGAFVGAVGNSTAVGTCAAGAQTAWCTGGNFSTSGIDGGLSGASHLSVEPGGSYLFVAETGNNRIQRFNLASGAFAGSIGNSTAAGTCSAGAQTAWCTGGTFSASAIDGGFSAPTGVVAPAGSYLYVGDRSNHRVQRFNLATGAFAGAIGNSTAAGTCVAGAQTAWCTGGTFSTGNSDGRFNQPRAVTANPAGTQLLVSDTANGRIQRFNAGSGAFINGSGAGRFDKTDWSIPTPATRTILGVTDPEFQYPYGVSVDSAGSFLYVTDTNNYRIQKFNASTGAFVGAIGKSSASGTCVAGGQTAWCAGGSFTFGTNDGEFNAPRAAVAAGGFLYVANSGGYRVQKFNASTGAVIGSIGYANTGGGTCGVGAQTGWCTGNPTAFFFTNTGDGMFSNPLDLAVTPDNAFLLVVDYSNHRIEKFNAGTGAFVAAVGRSSASGTCINGAQTAWCTGGVFSSGAGDGMFSWPQGIAIDPAGQYFYVTDSANYRVQRFNLSTGAFAGATGKSTAAGTCVSGAQTAWCTGGNFSSAATDGALNTPIRIAIDAAGTYFYVSESNNHRVQKFNLSTGAFAGSIGWVGAIAAGTCALGVPSTWCTGGTSWPTGIFDGMFNSPQGLWVHPSGTYIYVSDSSNHRIQRFTPP